MKNRNNIQRITIALFRYYPAVCAIFMLNHVLSLIIGVDTRFHEAIVDSSLVAAVMQWMLSLAFGFCGWHRACIAYTYVVSLCVDYQRSVGFGDMRMPFRYIVLVAGITILAMFFFKCKHNEVYSDFSSGKTKD